MEFFPGRRACLAVAAIAAVDAAWIALTPLELPLWQLATPLGIVAMLMLALAVLGLVRPSGEATARLFRRIALLLQGLAFLQVAWVALRLLNHATMATGVPYADQGLAAADLAFGLDWRAYFAFVHDRPLLLGLLDLCYTSLTLLSSLALFAFVLFSETRRARFFIEAFLATAVICMAAGMWFPAEAAVVFYGIDLGQFPNFPKAPGVYHMAHLAALRGAGPVPLDLTDLPGLVTFPSFHTAAGIVMSAAAYRTRGFLPAALYTAGMVASTPVFGGHYFVDLIAGTLVACLVLVALARRPEYAGLFAPERRPAPLAA